LLRQNKVTKEKATPVYRRCAVPCVARLVRRLRNSRYALRQSSPKSPDQSARLGGAQGKEKQNPKPQTSEEGNKLPSSLYNKKSYAQRTQNRFVFPLSAASIRCERAVELGEHCLSTWPRSGSCELRSPARLRLIEGTPQGRQTGGDFFGLPFLARQER